MRRRAARGLVAALTLVVALPVVSACSNTAPRAIVEGEDNCTQCHMGIAELRFAAQAKTSTGKVLVFDSVECLARFVSEDSATVWEALHVSDFEAPGVWLPAEQAQFMVGGSIVSPMGMRIAAFPGNADAAKIVRVHEGRIVTWEDVLALVRDDRNAPNHDHTGMS